MAKELTEEEKKRQQQQNMIIAMGQALKPIDGGEAVGNDGEEAFKGMMSGAGAGASSGSPEAAAVGAGAGALAGIMQARAKRKQRAAKIQGQMHENIGAIEQQKGSNAAAALANLMSTMGTRR